MAAAIAAALALVIGCSSQTSSENGTAIEEAIVKDGGENIVVGYSQIGSESDYRIANTQSFKSVFTEDNGYYLLYEDAQQKQENQLRAVRNFILQNVDYIILDPIVETGWDAVFQEAKAAGIPIILADRYVEASEDLYTCWVGSDFKQEGRRAAEWLLHYLKERGRDKEEIQIVTLQGTLGSSAQIGRTKGFSEILDKQDNWKMLERKSGEYTQARGQEIMAEFLENYPDIDVVISENDNMTFGAIDAIKDAGKTCGPDGDIIMLSFDAVRAALEAMRDGEIHADFECNPLLGPEVEKVIRKLEAGEEVEKIQYVEETYYDYTMDLEEIMKTRIY